MENLSRSRGPTIQYLHEAMFALNTSCAIVSCTFAASEEVYNPFAHLEIRINHFLHIRQTDFIRGHFAFWIPALTLALCAELLLRVFSRARLTSFVLRPFAGATAFLLLPTVWIYADRLRGWPFVSLYEGLEVAIIIIVFLLICIRSPSVPGWVGPVAAVLHFFFWYLFLNGFRAPNWEKPGYLGPAGPFLTLCASLAWAAYFGSCRNRVNDEQSLRGEI